MENRLQYIFLKTRRKLMAALITSSALMAVPAVQAAALSIDNEFFELGLSAGVLDIEDFTSELTLGAYTTFRATENFFLQSNYFQADVSLSSVERGPQGPFSGDRQYTHFNLLLGYNVFQGEVFKGRYAGLSSLYVLAGVGDTEFLDESNFTYVYGVGYQMALLRRLSLRFDYQHYQYDSIVTDQLENSINNTRFSIGASWLF